MPPLPRDMQSGAKCIPPILSYTLTVVNRLLFIMSNYFLNYVSKLGNFLFKHAKSANKFYAMFTSEFYYLLFYQNVSLFETLWMVSPSLNWRNMNRL